MVSVAGYQVMYVEWMLVIVTLGLMCLRIYCRIKLKGTLRTWHDAFAILSWCSFFILANLDTNLYRHGFFDSEEANIELRKTLYVDGTAYFWGLYSVKASMLCFYTEFVPRFMRKTRFLLWFTIILVFSAFVVTQCIAIFRCEPIYTNWSLDRNTYCSSASTSVVAYSVTYTLHLLGDILVYTIPLIVISRLPQPTSQKAGVGALFGLGFMCILFAMAVITSTWTTPVIGVWWILGCFEQAWAVVIVCAPSFKYFMAKMRRVRIRVSISLIRRTPTQSKLTQDATASTEAVASSNSKTIASTGEPLEILDSYRMSYMQRQTAGEDDDAVEEEDDHHITRRVDYSRRSFGIGNPIANIRDLEEHQNRRDLELGTSAA